MKMNSKYTYSLDQITDNNFDFITNKQVSITPIFFWVMSNVDFS